MPSEYEVEVTVRHTVIIWADNKEEAEEVGYDTFMDEESFWEVDIETYELEEDE